MRTLVEVIVVALLIGAGWNKPFKEHLGGTSKSSGSAQTARSTAQQKARPAGETDSTSTPSAAPGNAWMWDPNRAGSLDRKTTPHPPGR